MSKRYEISLEIAGPTAMWTRPDTGSAPISAPAPSFSAAKGIFESILLHRRETAVVPIKVEICAPIYYHRYVTNYGGPLRKTQQVESGSSYQLTATVLVNVCYRLYAEIQDFDRSGNGINHRHAYQDQFFRRLKRGQFFRVPCLGWSEFLPSYIGEFRESTSVVDVSETLPTMLKTVFDKAHDGRVAPTFSRNVKIEKGVLEYAK